MKDHIKPKLANCLTFDDVKVVVDDYMDYYNNRRYQWKLAKLSPNEFYNFVTTGEYPLDIPKVSSCSGDPKDAASSQTVKIAVWRHCSENTKATATFIIHEDENYSGFL